MAVKHTTKVNKFPEMRASIKTLDDLKINVGYIAGGELAWLAGIHEYGCRIAITDKMRRWLHANGLHVKKTTTHIVIPERSFLRAGFDQHNGEVLRKVDDLIPDVVEGAMAVDEFAKVIGLLMKSKIQAYAIDLKNPALHPFTIERTGNTNPLVGTGDMIGAIDWEMEK